MIKRTIASTVIWTVMTMSSAPLAGCSARTDTHVERWESRTVLVKLCHDAARGQLRAPATAQFSGEVVTSNGTGWTVVGDVDAQNGYGALIRNRWSCRAVRSSNGTWILSGLDWLDR